MNCWKRIISWVLTAFILTSFITVGSFAYANTKPDSPLELKKVNLKTMWTSCHEQGHC